MSYSQARNFIYRNARPLDIARWKYLFEGGRREDVLTALSAYQNADGGFGHALEADCWNPVSSPIQTWAATEILQEVRLTDRSHPIIAGILRYLASGQDFDGHVWYNAVPTNNNHPHAPWWQWMPEPEITYNPTASLLGFILLYADRDSMLYTLAQRLTKEAYGYLQANAPLNAMHTVACFAQLYHALHASGQTQLVDIDAFRTLLRQQIQNVLTLDTATWSTEYVCKPSLFIHGKEDEFYPVYQEICQSECDFILQTQQPEGYWGITWAWPDYPEQWAISKNWWLSDVTIKNLKFLQAIRGIDKG